MWLVVFTNFGLAQHGKPDKLTRMDIADPSLGRSTDETRMTTALSIGYKQSAVDWYL